MTDNTVVMHRIRSVESGTTDAILRACSTVWAVRARTDSIRTPDRPLRDSGVELMMLAFIECKNGLHEPTADTAEETEADLPATETGSGQSGHIRLFPVTRGLTLSH